MSFLKVAVEGAFQLFYFRGNKGIMSKVGVSDGIVVECVFEKRDSCVVKDEVGEFIERCQRMKWTYQYLPNVLKGSNPRLGKRKKSGLRPFSKVILISSRSTRIS